MCIIKGNMTNTLQCCFVTAEHANVLREHKMNNGAVAAGLVVVGAKSRLNSGFKFVSFSKAHLHLFGNKDVVHNRDLPWKPSLTQYEYKQTPIL